MFGFCETCRDSSTLPRQGQGNCNEAGLFAEPCAGTITNLTMYLATISNMSNITELTNLCVALALHDPLVAHCM